MNRMVQIERRNKKHEEQVAQAWLDGQVNCPRKGPLRPQISVGTCLALHAQNADECERCTCRLHSVAGVRLAEIKKTAASGIVVTRKELR